MLIAAAALTVEITAGAALVRIASAHEQIACEKKGVVYDRVYYPDARLIIEPETGTSWIESESGARHYLTIGG